MKEKIIEILEKYNRAISLEEIDSILNIKTIDETKRLIKTLNEMEKDLEIYRSNKNKYMLFTNSNLKKGILSTTKNGYGFVNVENEIEDIFIDYDNLNGAINQDNVIVEIINQNENGKKEGRILKITKRELSQIVGTYMLKKGKASIIPDDDKLNIKIEISKKDSLGAVPGHKVIVKLLSSQNKNHFKGKVIKILGHKDDPGVDILSIMAKYNLKTEFSRKTEAELLSIPSEVIASDKMDRRDLTNEVIFTIDGDDTKDIDDAISCKKLPNGNYELGVHIADVSHYVKQGSSLDKDAEEKGTSVYLVDRVVPMLPHQLSNGICSLNPNVERLTISCVMEIDEKGQVISHEIFKSVIKSQIQMTYKKVNEILDNKSIPEGYEKYKDTLLLMYELSCKIRENKLARGYLDFDVDEAKILVDDNAIPVDIKLRERGKGENLIEDFMIAANETVAQTIYYMNLPFIYRVHEPPKEEKIKNYLNFLQTMGYSPKGNIKGISSKQIQNLLDYLKDKKEFKILSNALLRNMQKAVYLPQNLGHFGLASKCYTHFTSPIRRYPDTTVHRLLKDYLFSSNISIEKVNYWEEKLPFIADHSSVMERISIDCERDVESMKMAEYMEKHIGEEFEGMISGVMNFGLFVQLDNLVEGLVHITNMEGYYKYDETSQSLIGETKGKRYRLGDKVLIKVLSSSKETSNIDFIIIKKL